MSIPKPDGPDIDIAPSMLGTGWTLYTISAAILAARIYTQLRITRQFGIGDIFMICAVFTGYVHILFIHLGHHWGWGRHFYYLSDYQRVMASEMTFIAEPFGILCSMFGRVSFVCLMFRLFGTNKPRRWFLYFLIAETLVINLVTCITIFTQCGNVISLWDPAGHPSKCWAPDVQADIGFFQGATNSLTDLVLTILPSTIFFTLQMKMRIKFGLAALLGLSIFAFAASIVKTVKLKTLGERSDYTFNTVNFMNWVVIENTFVIIASSIPLLRPLFNIAKDTAMTHYGQSSSYELGSRGAGGTKVFANVTNKSVNLASSSEENILPIQKGNGTVRTQSTHVHRPGDSQLEGGIIKKEVTYQVRYDKDDGSTDSTTAGNWDSKKGRH